MLYFSTHFNYLLSIPGPLITLVFPLPHRRIRLLFSFHSPHIFFYTIYHKFLYLISFLFPTTWGNITGILLFAILINTHRFDSYILFVLWFFHFLFIQVFNSKLYFSQISVRMPLLSSYSLPLSFMFPWHMYLGKLCALYSTCLLFWDNSLFLTRGSPTP